MAYDAQIATAGITTVFDSLRAGSDADSTDVGTNLAALAGALTAAQATGHLRAEHLTHLRCEIASHDVIEQVNAFNREVLPAPFAPSIAQCRPCSTRQWMSLSMVTLPRTTRSPATSRIEKPRFRVPLSPPTTVSGRHLPAP